jgi:hypothetical protein
MHLNKTVLFVLLAYLPVLLYAQAGSVQRDPVDYRVINMQDAVVQKGVPAYSLDNPNLALGKRIDSINYDKITGSPFWADEPRAALLYSGTKYIGTVPVRINFVTNEIYFTKDNEEMVLTNDAVNTLVFKSAGDTAVFISQVQNLNVNKKPVQGFVQVLNKGKLQLLKYIKRRVTSMESPSHISINYYFTDDTYYFMLAGDKAVAVKKLNKENLLPFFIPAKIYNDWAKENNINFKNEKEVVQLLDYYNTHNQ